MTDLSAWRELGTLALISAWCHGPASPFLPAAFEPVLLAYGRVHPPLIVAVVSTLASIPVEAVNYLGYRWLLDSNRLRRVREASTRVTRLFARQPFLTCLLVAATPVPDWSARILGALARYSSWRFLVAFALGRLPLFWALAAAGSLVRLDGSAAAGLVVASALVTYVGVALRRWRGAVARTAP
jgi:membrane protein YqaA with SNARE-associated domain